MAFVYPVAATGRTPLGRTLTPLVRLWALRDYEKHLKCHIRPTLGDTLLTEITAATLETFRAELLQKGLALKTARNVIDGTFRALYRDARVVDQLVTGDPFTALRWPRRVPRKVDPFAENERDAIVAYFWQSRPRYHPFVLAAFWTGGRPSELIALRWGDVALRAGKLSIHKSRTLHEDNPTKTPGSERTIDLVPAVVAALRDAKPLPVTDQDFVFRNTEGRPIFGDSFSKHEWHRALRACGIRPRKFYATRHTFISVALTRGWNLKALAEYCGTSVAMIERHYGSFLKSETQAQLALLGAPAAAEHARAVPAAEVQPSVQPSTRQPKKPYAVKWRRGESNPRPKVRPRARLRA